MDFFYQFYFILYRHFYNRAKYINTPQSGPERYAARIILILFCGWIFLTYYGIINIFNLRDIDIKYGKFIVIAMALIAGGLITNYFCSNGKYLIIWQ